MHRFSPWSDGPEDAPGGTLVVQVKVLGGLLDYPRGKSAMVWYGVVEDCTPAAVAEALARVAAALPGRPLVWRRLEVERPGVHVAELLARFEARFGGAPWGQGLVGLKS